MSARVVSGVVLAAGESRRFGETKQLLHIDGVPLVRRVATQALASQLAEVIVVVGHDAAAVAGAVKDLDVVIVNNPLYGDGQSTSLRAGLARVSGASDAAMFLVADQPFLTAGVIDALVAAYQDSGDLIVVPVFGGQRRSPVIFDRTLFAELEKIQGDVGGRKVFATHATEIVEIPFASGAPFLDVDTREEWRLVKTES